MATLDTNVLSNQSTATLGSPVNASGGSLNVNLSPVKLQQINEKLDKNASASLLQYPVDRPKYYMIMNIRKYQRDNLLRIADVTTEDTIILPIPQTLIDSNGVIYEEQEIGQLTGAGYNKLFGSNVKSKSDIEKQIQNNTGLGYLAQSVGAQTLDAATGLNTSGLLAAMTGFSPNQFLTILLKGPEYKRHELSWVLSPRNEMEAERIRLICNKINNSKAPGITAGGLFFTFPKVFELGFMPNSQYLFKFKPAVLESFTVNYAPGGSPAFYKAKSATNGNNPPVGVEIRMRFLELEFWLTGDYTNSNDPFDRRQNVASPAPNRTDTPNAGTGQVPGNPTTNGESVPQGTP